ncbi:MAG: MBL fold metallo-hydrolase [Myxococcales bacterium]|nr:MBL fold metallo-hydrolase [Myxococcales bacterium]MCB9643654.1 MBL fold metallo-hydrolase [Myxococcales bacterium]
MSKAKALRADFVPNEEEREALLGSGLVRIPLDTPFPVDPVNVTLVLGDPPALIDTGLRHGENRHSLEEALAEHGLRIRDLGEIYMTHPHLDHFGLAGELAQESGARVFAWSESVSRYEDYVRFADLDRKAFGSLLSQAGANETLMGLHQERTSHFNDTAGPVEITDPFVVGEPLWIAGRHRVLPLHVPGHSPWCVAYWFEEAQILVTGDALLPRITSNPLWYPQEAAPSSWQGLEAYTASLEKMSELPIQWAIPGHGASFQEVTQSAQRAIYHLTRRQKRVMSILEDGQLSLFELAEAMFGEHLARQATFLVMSEAVRHVDWLRALGRLQEHPGSLLRYSLL